MNKPTTVITMDHDNVYEKVFLNVQVLDFLRRGVELLCIDYAFDRYDAEKINERAKQPDAANRVFIWLCRPHGTNICSERNAFIKDTGSYKTLLACATPFVSAYALLVEITGVVDGEPTGNVYKLNLAEYVREVQYSAVWQKAHKVTYDDGHTQTFSLDSKISWYPDHGHVVSDEPIPESETALLRVLKNHANRRKNCVELATETEE